MDNMKSEHYRGYDLQVTVEERAHGVWHVRQQTLKGPDIQTRSSVAHVQHSGPFGSAEHAFAKGFKDLKAFVDEHLKPDPAREDARGQIAQK